MLFSEEQLNEIQNMASLFFPPEDIAINIEVDQEDFLNIIRAKSGEAYKRFMAGRITSDIELRKAVQQSALNGSTPAQQTMLQWQNQSKP